MTFIEVSSALTLIQSKFNQESTSYSGENKGQSTICRRNIIPESIPHFVVYFWQQVRKCLVELRPDYLNVIWVVGNFRSKCVFELQDLSFGKR